MTPEEKRKRANARHKEWRARNLEKQRKYEREYQRMYRANDFTAPSKEEQEEPDE